MFGEPVTGLLVPVELLQGHRLFNSDQMQE
jgi:hypothetical protein